jgi:Chaperone of endosialidase
LAASPFFLQPSLFVCCTFFSHFVFERRHFRRDSAHIVARRDARRGRLGVAGESNNIRIRNFYSSFVDGRYVFVDSDNKIGTLVSSRRFKEEIKPMDRASETIHALKPVTFRYKKEIDSAGTSQFGLVAEDVEKVSPALIVRDKEGKPYSVRYDQVNAMLLNEFLKEHRKVEQQRKDFEAAIAQQQKQIEALIEGLQKVSAQLEASKPATQTVLHSR